MIREEMYRRARGIVASRRQRAVTAAQETLRRAERDCPALVELRRRQHKASDPDGRCEAEVENADPKEQTIS